MNFENEMKDRKTAKIISLIDRFGTFKYVITFEFRINCIVSIRSFRALASHFQWFMNISNRCFCFNFPDQIWNGDFPIHFKIRILRGMNHIVKCQIERKKSNHNKLGFWEFFVAFEKKCLIWHLPDWIYDRRGCRHCRSIHGLLNWPRGRWISQQQQHKWTKSACHQFQYQLFMFFPKRHQKQQQQNSEWIQF